MMSALNLILFLSFILYTSAQSNNSAEAPKWSHANPEEWGGECNGFQQSPIHLSTENSFASASLPPLIFQNYDVPLSGPLILTNNGHSVSMDIPPTLNGRRPFFKSSMFSSRFEAVALHFHWGSRINKGSEHVIDGQRFDAEMHLVHKNSLYETMEEATKYPDGLAVLAVLIEKENDPVNYYPGLYKIFRKVPQLIEHKSKAKINFGFSLDNLLGDLYRKEFFTYKGSLTTPPCSEAVTWFVFPDAIPIRMSEINKLFNLIDSHNETLINNFRPVQDLNGRRVQYRYQRQSLQILPILRNLPIIG